MQGTDPDLSALVMGVGEIWTDYNPGASIEEATLEMVWSANGVVTDTMTYTFQLPALQVGDVHVVPNLGDGRSLTGCSAQLTFRVKKSDNTEATVLNPVEVKP
jgi:hypothetical protein